MWSTQFTLAGLASLIKNPVNPCSSVNPRLAYLPYIDRALQISSDKEGTTVKRVFVMVLLAAASITFASQQARAQMNSMDDNPMVGGAAMFKSKDIVDNAVNSADHTTLVAAV